MRGEDPPKADAFSPNPYMGYPELSEDPVSPEGKAEAVGGTQCKKLLENSSGICCFSAWGVPGVLSFENRVIAAATGRKDSTIEEALPCWEVGHYVAANIQYETRPNSQQ